MKAHLYCLILLCLFTKATRAQIGFGGTPHPSAAIDVPSTTKAAYLPRMSSAQRIAIVNPQVGAIVFDLDKTTLYLYDGQNWLPMATTSANALAPVSRTASDGMSGDGMGVLGDSFGQSVSIWGDYALIGAPQDVVNGQLSQGSAYVFVRIGRAWTQQAKLLASDGSGGNAFGSSVSLSGDYAFIGTGVNSAYVFFRNGTAWNQQQKLTSSANSGFGQSVSISGDYALVGAFYETVGENSHQGSAYIFMRSGTTWTQQAKLVSNDGYIDDAFGSRVALSGDYALIGAPQNDANSATNTNQGAAYVFSRNVFVGSGNTWSQQAKLTASEGSPNDQFGWGVALSGSYAVVGSVFNDLGANTDQGAAYVFSRSGTSWTQLVKLTAFDGSTDDHFGGSVSIGGDYIIVGATGADGDGYINQGACYVYQRSGINWVQVRRVDDNSPPNTRNGSSVGMSNGTFVIGGPGFQLGKGKVSFGVVE
ncbi:FG-GAP repeat protein [Spirosoma sp. BT702]|uniref:FG-GAP repeat protein n=1 Tax=Spirosoma profusum TaxID=2771354 RepID=A0A927APB5_9BACT|nr:FG-GAP repeat protein [Spirosoma profusum]MBD2703814.1 FG-GAP repeat protein [Spirosoma profusum]